MTPPADDATETVTSDDAFAALEAPTPGTAPSPGRLGINYYKLLTASGISNLGDGIGLIAYPWLASAITRNPILIALVAVVQRLPWLVFSLPAGVITDRNDRRKLMVWSNAARAVLTTAVALMVLLRQGDLPGPDSVADSQLIVSTDLVLYLVLLLATLSLGVAEVLYDNSGQTFMPSVVASDKLEKANGRMWSVEMIANTFAGPPLGAPLIAVAFSLSFFVDAATFALSAAIIASISVSVKPRPPKEQATSWTSELAEGVRWLWSHELLRPMAIILGLMNGLGTLTGALLVLFAQEVLDTSATEFALLNTGGAIGGVIGGWVAGSVAKRIGTGPSLWLTLLGGAVTNVVIGLTSWWGITWFMFAVFMMLAVLWNVITVSLRQTIIPDELLGRVNSVYRFFAWGMMPIGALLGGLIVSITDRYGSRELALRLPWFIAAGGSVLLFVFGAPRLSTAKIEAARSAATADT
ncbi:MAG: MFS transporter [Acidimicrobiales bacterium]